MLTRPQLGVMPRYLWEESRLYELREAIQRFTLHGSPIPVEWIEEYNEKIKVLTGRS